MSQKRGLTVVAIILLFGCVEGGRSAADVVPVVRTVEEVRGQIITTQEGTVYKVDVKTEYVKKTKSGEVKAKLDDLKPGTAIEVQMEKGAKAVKKIVIRQG